MIFRPVRYIDFPFLFFFFAPYIEVLRDAIQFILQFSYERLVSVFPTWAGLRAEHLVNFRILHKPIWGGSQSG